MALSAGARFGPYEVLDLLGAGGMGEVYRARDTRLKRDVAIKVLPEGVATDTERLARFHREAELLASLNHPNIAAIYGLEQAETVTALVLELIEGETLADRLARGPVRFSEAMAIARQLVEALDAAHGRGVIHRDLKPANIKITPDDKVKVLDFGLAAVVQSSGAHDVNVTHSPTLTLGATRAGVILGTAAYMSPEQATGSAADKRADVWAFGVVLWEMLTGKRIFEGETVSHTLAFVITKEPDWNALPPSTPASIRRLLRRCLEKDRKRRLPDIASAQMEIDDAVTTSSTDVGVTIPAPQISQPLWRRALPWAFAAAATLALAIVVALWAPRRTPPPLAPVRVSSELGADALIGSPGAPAATLAISRDGRLLAFVAANTGLTQIHLYIRRMDRLQATALPGTENARDPFFSPDGEWVAFFAEGKLKKISVTGGAAVPLCDAPAGRGGWWAEDGTIVFVPNSTAGTTVLRVSASGGTPEPVTTRAQAEIHRWPQSLKGGRAVLFSESTSAGAFDNANIVVQSMAEGTRKIVHRGGYFARYLPSGHLMYVSGGTVFAAAFDIDRLEMTGQPVPVLEGVEASTGTGAVQLAVSDSGTLVYLAGSERGLEVPLTWMDRSGRTTPLRGTPSDWSNPSFSPDGNRLAYDVITGGTPDLWIYEWARDTATRLTFDKSVDAKPIWTPDGRRIAFASNRERAISNLFWQRADGGDQAQRLTESTNTQVPGSWHPSGKFLAFSEQNPTTNWDILILPVEGDEASGWKMGKPTVFLNGPSAEQEPMFSPDGRWLAYFSDESRQQQVYVRPFPGPGGLQQISNDGGQFPSWSRTRSELFFREPGTQQIMVASYTTAGDSFRADKPRAWAPGRSLPRPRMRSYALHPDGGRIAMAAATDPRTAARTDKVVFVFNFFDELRRLAPVSR